MLIFLYLLDHMKFPTIVLKFFKTYDNPGLCFDHFGLNILVKGFIMKQFTLSKVQKILRNATRSENTFQSFSIEGYENFFFS